jgi:hypothetical protein
MADVPEQPGSVRRAWKWTTLGGPLSAPRSCCRRRSRLDSFGRPAQQLPGQLLVEDLGLESAAAAAVAVAVVAARTGCLAGQHRQRADVLLSLHRETC